MITAIPGIEDLTAHINSFLPDQVRMWGFVRVNSGFNARLFAPPSLLPSPLLLADLLCFLAAPATPESTSTSFPRTSSSLPNLEPPSPTCSRTRPWLPRLHHHLSLPLCRTTPPSTPSGRKTGPRELGTRMRPKGRIGGSMGRRSRGRERRSSSLREHSQFESLSLASFSR